MITRHTFLDLSVINEDNIIPFLEILDKGVYDIYLDQDIENEIQSLIDNKENNNYFQVIEIINYLASYHRVTRVQTNKYLDFKTLKELEVDIDNISIITQSKSVAENFKSEFELEHEILFYQSKDGTLTKWNLAKQLYKNAFYVEHINFSLEVDAEKITHVYSYKFGYLKLLGDPIAKGGEGIIYKTYNNLLAKVYLNKHLTYMNYKKLQTMLEKDIHNPYIVWPVDLIYYQGTFVGYIMPEISQTSSIDELRDLGFPGFSIKDRFEVGLTFLRQVEYLHHRNIIVGDMKFDNILVRNPKELYFVDTGSFQVDDYPCPVFLKEFTGRDFTTDELKKKLRNVEDEYFPINKILFEIMMLKNPFYSKDSIEIDVNAPRVFHYPLDKAEIKEKPTQDQVIWFNLSENMREYYYYYFTQNKITPINVWIKELENFISKI